MIPLVIALLIAALCIIIAVLSVFVTVVIRRNSRLEREKKRRVYELESAIAAEKALKEQVDRLQETNNVLSESLTQASQDYNLLAREHRELEARTSALQKTLEAQPTAPKRAMRKNSASASGEGT